MKGKIGGIRVFIAKTQPVHSRLLNTLFKISCLCIILSLSGAVLNFIVIYANNGKMPVFGIYSKHLESSRHLTANESTVLPILADWIEINTTKLGGDSIYVVSIGDLLLCIFGLIAILIISILIPLSLFLMRLAKKQTMRT